MAIQDRRENRQATRMKLLAASEVVATLGWYADPTRGKPGLQAMVQTRDAREEDLDLDPSQFPESPASIEPSRESNDQ